MSMHVNAELALLPEIDGLEDIVGDILQDDRRATKVLRRVHSPLKKAPSGGSIAVSDHASA